MVDGKQCNCGMPQSNPIPHIHDMSLREKKMYDYYEKELTSYRNKLERVESVTRCVIDEDKKDSLKDAFYLKKLPKEIIKILTEDEG